MGEGASFTKTLAERPPHPFFVVATLREPSPARERARDAMLCSRRPRVRCAPHSVSAPLSEATRALRVLVIVAMPMVVVMAMTMVVMMSVVCP